MRGQAAAPTHAERERERERQGDRQTEALSRESQYLTPTTLKVSESAVQEACPTGRVVWHWFGADCLAFYVFASRHDGGRSLEGYWRLMGVISMATILPILGGLYPFS